MNQIYHDDVVRIPSLSYICEEVEGGTTWKDSRVEVEYKENDESCKVAPTLSLPNINDSLRVLSEVVDSGFKEYAKKGGDQEDVFE
jgi:hypothetical protein